MRKNNKSRIEVKRIVNSISENDKEKKCKYIPINTSDVYDGSFNANAYVDYSDLKGQFKKKFKKGDILFSEIRPIQKHFVLIDFDETEDYLVSTKLMVLRNCNKEVDTRYFYYWLTSSDTLNKLQKMAENRIASFPQITFDENLSNLLVPLHTIEHQKKISNLIDMIDRLLKINSLINDNLSNQLQMIYNYWFNQFEFPNKNNKPYKSNGGKMIYSNQFNKEIPCDFNVQNIINNNISSVIKTGINKFNSNKVYYATADINGCDIDEGSIVTFDNRETRANMQPTVNSVWFAKMKKSIKHLYLNENMLEFINNSILSTGFFGIQCKHETFEYLSSFIEYSAFESQKDSLSHGATQQAVNNEDLLNVCLLIPTNEVLIKYHNLTKNLYKELSNNKLENKMLKRMKNYLLPLLINGQATIS